MNLTADISPLRNHLHQVLLGKEDQIDLVIACLLSRGHLLFDDLPGMGKTTLAKAIAGGVRGDWRACNAPPT